MQYYVVTFTHTKLAGWAAHLHAHVEYLNKLIDEGKLQISGPGVDTPIRSAQLVFKTTDREELDQLVANDPYSIHDLVASQTTNLWDVQVGSMEKPATPDPKGTKYFRAAFALPEGTDTSAVDAERKAYLEALLDERKIRAAGTYVNAPSEGLSILSVPGKEAAEEIMKNDPFVKELGAKYEVIEWDPKFGDFK